MVYTKRGAQLKKAAAVLHAAKKPINGLTICFLDPTYGTLQSGGSIAAAQREQKASLP